MESMYIKKSWIIYLPFLEDKDDFIYKENRCAIQIGLLTCTYSLNGKKKK